LYKIFAFLGTISSERTSPQTLHQDAVPGRRCVGDSGQKKYFSRGSRIWIAEQKVQMMFNGISKGRVVSSSGKKRDLSRNSVIEESRKQREQRALDKKRNGSALIIQKNCRQYFSQKQLRKEIMNQLEQQLVKISHIESLLPDFALPFETVLLLMKYSVLSRAMLNEPEKWKNVVVRITNSFRSPNFLREWQMKLTDNAKIHSFQIILVSFCRDFLTLMKDSNFPQIIEFLGSLIELLEPKPLGEAASILFRNCIQGVFQLLHHQPYWFLRKVLLSNQAISAELEELSVALLRLCEVFLLGNLAVDLPLLGSGQYSWASFSTCILSIPNLFQKTWARKYLNRYHSSDRLDELSHHWNSALASISSRIISEEEALGLSCNLFAIVSNSPADLLQGLSPQLWKSLLSKSLQDDRLLLKAVRLYHDLHSSDDEEDDSVTVEGIGSLATLDNRINLSQGRISNLIQGKEEATQLVLGILNSLLQSSLLRFWLGTISRDSGELLEEDSDLLVLFSRLLIFTPPPLLVGNQFSIQSVPSGLRTLAYLPVQFLYDPSRYPQSLNSSLG
jgi:hypothetical protein